MFEVLALFEHRRGRAEKYCRKSVWDGRITLLLERTLLGSRVAEFAGSEVCHETAASRQQCQRVCLMSSLLVTKRNESAPQKSLRTRAIDT
jgi:hypothetical protein